MLTLLTYFNRVFLHFYNMTGYFDKKTFFGVKHIRGAIFAGVRRQFCQSSEPSPVGFAALLRGSE